VSKQSTIHLILPDGLVPSVPSKAEVELIASILGELLVLVLRLDGSEDD